MFIVARENPQPPPLNDNPGYYITWHQKRQYSIRINHYFWEYTVICFLILLWLQGVSSCYKNYVTSTKYICTNTFATSSHAEVFFVPLLARYISTLYWRTSKRSRTVLSKFILLKMTDGTFFSPEKYIINKLNQLHVCIYSCTSGAET